MPNPKGFGVLADVQAANASLGQTVQKKKFRDRQKSRSDIMQNIIWSNDIDQIDAIIDDWKQEATQLAEAMANNPKETMADAVYGVDVILEKAWEDVVGEYELPTPQQLVEAIEAIDEDDTSVRIVADGLNTEYRADEQDNLRHLGLKHPVIILGKAGLWNGSRTLASVVDFDNIGDIIADSPWAGMEYETWKIDGHDDLRYIGVHHDGVNTCTFRELKTDGHGEKPIEENDLRALLRASRPLGPRVREVYGMPAPAKKHGNR